MLINSELEKVPAKVSVSGVVSAVNLYHKGDNTHFDSNSARKLGERMAIKMYTLQNRKTENTECMNTDDNNVDKWQSLFKTDIDTINWIGIQKRIFPDDGWLIRNNELILLSGKRGGDIITKKKYSNFELELEFKMTKYVNSGIKYFVNQMRNEKNKNLEWIGFEYQIIDDFHQDDIPGFDDEKGSTAALYLLYAPDKNKMLKPLGTWNSLKVKVEDNNIEHWLNGIMVLKVNIHSKEFQDLVQKSKFQNYSDFGKLRKGHILIILYSFRIMVAKYILKINEYSHYYLNMIIFVTNIEIWH